MIVIGTYGRTGVERVLLGSVAPRREPRSLPGDDRTRPLRELRTVTIEEVTTPRVITVHPETSVQEAARLMSTNHISGLPRHRRQWAGSWG
jgi:CBS domain-containing protein